MLVQDNLKQQQAGTALVFSHQRNVKEQNPSFSFFMAEKHFVGSLTQNPE